MSNLFLTSAGAGQSSIASTSTSSIGYGSSGALTINSTAGVTFFNSNGVTQLGGTCNISSTGVLNCTGLTITTPLSCSGLTIANGGSITCTGSLTCSGNLTFNNTLNMNGNAITNAGGLTISARPFQWIMTSANAGDGTTPVGSNIGAMNTQTGAAGAGFSLVNIFGGASTTAWNTGTATFTAPTSGLYHFQLNVFNNSSLNLSGRYIMFFAPTTSILGGSQYCYFNYTAIATGTSFNWTQMIWLDAGGPCYFFNQSQSGTSGLTFYYGNGHTTLNIVRIY